MRELELLNVLKLKHDSGFKDFLCVKQIEIACQEKGLLVNNRLREQLNKLYAFGYLESERNGFRGLKYRIKQGFVSQTVDKIKSPFDKDLNKKEYSEMFDLK